MALRKEHRDWLTLALVPGVGTAHFIRLLARFRTAENVLNASRGTLSEVVGEKLAERIAQYADVVDVDAQQRRMADYDVALVTLEDPEYPVRLAEIYDPPLALFVRGELREEDAHCVSIVGTRRPTPYGVRMAEKFGRELAARGITVVSGMAAGIDAAAHRGALENGGRTIAVLGNGVDIVYPAQNAELMHQIIQHGCVISQFPMGVKPSKGHFPYRNRIISGLALGTLIVEAPPQSGALITARQAAEQGREVFAVPGQVGVANSQGPHSLIRDGAKLVETVEDIIVELELPAECRQAPRAVEAPPEPERAETAAVPAAPKTLARRGAQPADKREKDVLSVLSPDGSFVDEIAMACRISVSEALSALTLLELKGLVRQFSGKRFAPR
ncbi:MAG TPA: DNA-protecting protein DprA [Candidatus Hydrogenedentes bacterium]|nr:DNA-protecting protein DprA [Candidatus Hydrogenedentota bacterium]HIJ74823.1 DNA-protecting protein DprA [Candidatus Hydrogenedentota bacterium]